MVAVSIYVLIGLVVCGIVALTRDPATHKSELPFAMFFDAHLPLILLWPLWLAVVLLERSFPREAPARAAVLPDHIGQIGVVVSALRPVGRVLIGETHFDARSDGRVIEAGSRVRVVSRSMAELVVEEAPAQGGPNPV